MPDLRFRYYGWNKNGDGVVEITKKEALEKRFNFFRAPNVETIHNCLVKRTDDGKFCERDLPKCQFIVSSIEKFRTTKVEFSGTVSREVDFDGQKKFEVAIAPDIYYYPGTSAFSPPKHFHEGILSRI